MNTAWTDALGTSEVFLEFQERLGRLADTERPVLVVGERGTGKELAVQRLHYLSSRWEKPLVTMLCPALSPALLESELFGHEAGAFTGARGRRPGYFERADRGTLFLDEVADMPLPLQDKLLRVLEYGSFERVGGTSPVHVDVRVLAATNRHLPDLVTGQRFRPDLLDRLAFDVLYVPPLRQRGEDKILLARHFAAFMGVELGLLEQAESQTVPELGDEALRQLESYTWPGNVRELKNVIERSMARRRSLFLEKLDIDPFENPYAPVPEIPEHVYRNISLVGQEQTCRDRISEGVPNPLPSGFQLHAVVEELEREALRVALEQARYRQNTAASLLGLTYHQFRALYRKYRKDS